MRKNEGDEVEAAFANRDLHFIRVNAEERFLSKLAGVTDPETKRKIIGAEFIAVFEEEARKLSNLESLPLRAPSIRMSSNRAPTTLPISRAIITLAACPSAWISVALLSRCAASQG